MATLTVWKLGAADGAERAAASLVGLRKQQLIEIVDAAVVEWHADKTRQAFDATGAGALKWRVLGIVVSESCSSCRRWVRWPAAAQIAEAHADLKAGRFNPNPNG